MWIRAWGLMHGEQKDVLSNWDRSQSFSASESLLWALILDMHHRQPSLRSYFSWRVTWQGDFCHLQEAANLILSWSSWYKAITSWHWVDTELLCSGAQQVVGAGISAETLCIIVIIVKDNLTLYLQKTHLPAQFGSSTVLLGSRTQSRIHKLTTVELSKVFLLSALGITVQDPIIHIKRLRFHLKWVLNSIEAKIQRTNMHNTEPVTVHFHAMLVTFM